MDEKEKQAMLHHEELQKQSELQANNGGNNGGFSGIIDDIRHKVVEEPYWLRPEGRAVTDDFVQGVDVGLEELGTLKPLDTPEQTQEHDSGETDSIEPQYTSEELQEAHDDFFDIRKEDRGQELEQSRAQDNEREIGL